MFSARTVPAGRIDVAGAPTATPADFGPPRGAFVVVEDQHGLVVAGGGLKGLDGRASQRLYERAGYRPIGNFDDNPFASFWGEKRL